jgi:hypothetical protein
VESYFPDGVLIGRTAFYSAFFRRCLILFVKENGHLLQLAKLHTKADREIFRFQHGLSEALTDLDMTPKAVVELISWLYSEVKSDDPNVVDTNVIDLANSLRKLCDSKPEIASALYGLIVLAEPVVLKSFHALILTSNYNHDPAFMAEMIALSSKEIYQATVVNSLINIDHKPGTPVQELIDVVENISDYNDDCLKELPIFYATMLKKVQPADTAQIQHCLDKLACLMENYPDLLGNVLFQMRFLTKYKEQVTEKIMRYIDSHELPEHFCGMVADVFSKHDTSFFFFTVLRKIALKLKTKFEVGDLRNVIYLMRSANATDFDENLLKVIIDDEGIVRYTAMRLLTSLSMVDGIRNFSNDLHLFSAVEQYKIVMAITNDFHEPKYIVPLIAPLLDSKFDLVRELVLHKLEVMTENYFTDIAHLSYIERIKNYTTEFDDKLKTKWLVKELDPRYTQSKYYRQFFTQSNKQMQQSIGKSVKENTFLAILGGGDDIMLAKGGGFKMGARPEIQQLSTIASSMSLPREYFLSPEIYDWKTRVGILENWKELLTGWEATISL